MQCLTCGKEIEIDDTTYSNYNSLRANKGEHTGNIYWCENCEVFWIDNFLTGKVEHWNY
jgi:predicted RNA-binding Zn-ribbon protein involved in translation (DUF1610 family)